MERGTNRETAAVAAIQVKKELVKGEARDLRVCLRSHPRLCKHTLGHD